MGYLGNGLTITGTQNSKRIVVDATPNQTISTVTGGYLIGQMDVYRNGVKLVDTQDYTASDGSSVTFLSAASQGDELEFVVFENFDVANALAKEGGTVNGSLLVSTASTFSSDLTVDGNVTIGGTLTYEDVTNIDSVGLITARDGIHVVGNGVSVASGIITAGSGVHIGPITGVAATLTAAGGAVFTGVVTATSFVGDGSGLSGVASTDNINTSTLAQFTGGVGIADSIFHIGDDNTAIRFPAVDTFTVETAGSEALRVDSSQRLLVNTDSAMETFGSAALQVATAAGGTLVLGRDDTSVSEDNGLGAIYFDTKAGGSFAESAVIAAEADADQGSGDYPSRLVFKTTADAAGSVTERLRITSAGDVGIGTATVRNSLKLDVEGAIGATAGSTANVSFANVDDEDSGMYFPTTGQLGLVAGGSRKLLVSSTGLTLNNGDFTLNNNDILGTGGINITGIVTATSYRGDGSQLSGISVGVTTHVGTASGIVTSVFLDDATDHKVTVTGFVTFTTTQSGTEGESHTLRIVNSGIATVGFSTYFLFPSGSVPVLPTADGAVSLISFTVHDSVGAGCTQLLAGASLNFSN